MWTVSVAADDQFRYTTNNGAITITQYIGTGGPVTIPDTITGLPVTSIGDAAFYVASVTEISIPGSVTNIGNSAFKYSWLRSITIPNSVTTVGSEAFSGCGSLKSAYISGSVDRIGDSAFFSCQNMTNVTISEGVKWVSGFFDCRSLTNVTIPSSVTNIGQGAFGSCIGLKTLTILDSATKIGAYAFTDCIQLTNLTLGNNITDIGTNAFYNCDSLTGITIPGSVAGIANRAFYDCERLTNVTILNGLSKIEDYAFYSCPIKDLSIPASVRDIGQGAFMSCGGMTSLTISEGVTNIGPAAFLFCASLPTVTVPASVTSIGINAFGTCASLTNITVVPANSVFSSLDGVLFNHDRTVLLLCPAGKTGTYTIPNITTSLADYALYECKKLTGMFIPGSVSSISNDSLGDCTGLLTIVFAGNAPAYIHPNAFGGTYANIYYLPGGAGWGAFPAVKLWNPQVQLADGMFGIRTNRFGFNIKGTTNLVVVIEACTNLANPTWTRLQTNTLTSGSSYFSEVKWTNYPSRFYRLHWR